MCGYKTPDEENHKKNVRHARRHENGVALVAEEPVLWLVQWLGHLFFASVSLEV